MSGSKRLQVSSPRSIQLTDAKIPGCLILQFPAFHDDRGSFVKTMQDSVFAEQGMETDFREAFYTVSGKNVLRGMHLQLPPHDHAKLVYCLAGSICDMALDLRVGSPTYGKHEVYELSAVAHNAVYLPRGIAHGFFVREGPAVVMYHVTAEHVVSHDAGVLWNSFGAPWPTADPIISPRDASLQELHRFESPFRYEGQNLYGRRAGDEQRDPEKDGPR